MRKPWKTKKICVIIKMFYKTYFYFTLKISKFEKKLFDETKWTMTQKFWLGQNAKPGLFVSTIVKAFWPWSRSKDRVKKKYDRGKNELSPGKVQINQWFRYFFGVFLLTTMVIVQELHYPTISYFINKNWLSLELVDFEKSTRVSKKSRLVSFFSRFE